MKLFWIVSKSDYTAAESEKVEKIYTEMFSQALSEHDMSFEFIDTKDLQIVVGAKLSVKHKGEELLISSHAFLLSNFSSDPSTEKFFSSLYSLIEASSAVLINDTSEVPGEWMSHKLVMCSELAKLDLPVVPSLYLFGQSDPEQITNSYREMDYSFPAVIKPARLGRGMGIFKVHSLSEFKSIWSVLKKSNLDFVLQPFIEHTADLRVYVINGEIASWQWRMNTSGDFRANVSLGAKTSDKILPAEIEKMSLTIGNLWQSDYYCVDWLCGSKPPVISEVCSSLGGFTGLPKEQKERMSASFITYVSSRIYKQKGRPSC